MPESYIVRIYRRDTAHPAGASGVVIAAEKGRERQFSFHGPNELLRILSLSPGGPRKATSRKFPTRARSGPAGVK